MKINLLEEQVFRQEHKKLAFKINVKSILSGYQFYGIERNYKYEKNNFI